MGRVRKTKPATPKPDPLSALKNFERSTITLNKDHEIAGFLAKGAELSGRKADFLLQFLKSSDALLNFVARSSYCPECGRWIPIVEKEKYVYHDEHTASNPDPLGIPPARIRCPGSGKRTEFSLSMEVVEERKAFMARVIHHMQTIKPGSLTN